MPRKTATKTTAVTNETENKSTETIQKEVDSYKKEAKMSFAELLESEKYAPKPLNRGQVVEGTVISNQRGGIMVDIGGKSEGLIIGRELETEDRMAKTLAPGDSVLVYVIQAENDNGNALLSLRRASNERVWRELQNSLDKKDLVEVSAIDQNREGLLVDFKGLRGFIPTSQLDNNRSDQLSLGRKIKATVLELDRKANRLVLSEKEGLGGEEKEKKQKLLTDIKVGETFEGSVTNILPFGLFIKIPSGLEGLVHISEIAWERVGNPNDYYKVGDKVQVKVIGVDHKNLRLNFSIKQLKVDPWESAHEKYYPGKVVSGKVSKVTPSGVLVTLEPGLDGMIELTHLTSPEKIQVGDEINAKVESLSAEMRRLLLKPQ